jgi:hypothetical protein
MSKRVKGTPMGNSEKKKRKHPSLSIVQKGELLQKLDHGVSLRMLLKNMVWEVPLYMIERNRKTSC